MKKIQVCHHSNPEPSNTNSGSTRQDFKGDTLSRIQAFRFNFQLQVIQCTGTEEKPNDTMRKHVRQIQKRGHCTGKVATFL